jgi:hypothetical protein
LLEAVFEPPRPQTRLVERDLGPRPRVGLSATSKSVCRSLAQRIQSDQDAKHLFMTTLVAVTLAGSIAGHSIGHRQDMDRATLTVDKAADASDVRLFASASGKKASSCFVRHYDADICPIPAGGLRHMPLSVPIAASARLLQPRARRGCRTSASIAKGGGTMWRSPGTTSPH